MGVSGGTDSSYLAHLLVSHGVRPLAVHFDNTWNSVYISSFGTKLFFNLNNKSLFIKSDVSLLFGIKIEISEHKVSNYHFVKLYKLEDIFRVHLVVSS